MIKKVFLILFTLMLTIVFCLNSYAFTPTNFDVSAEGVYLASLDTNSVLYSKNAGKKLYPASLTKLMTAVLLAEKVTDLDNTIITVSENAINSLLGTGSSVGGLKPGEEIVARDMFFLLLMSSAGDGACAIAEFVSGTNDEFVNLMNQKAAQLGMKSSHFVNPHGLHDDDQYSTPFDIYKLTCYALSFDIIKEAFSTKRYNMPATNKNEARVLATTNFLIDPSTAGYGYYYQYATGGKTGFTDEAGRCLVSTATYEGYSYICVLMNSVVYGPNGNYVRYEFSDSKKLYKWAFTSFEYKKLVSKSDIITEVNVKNAWNVDHVILNSATDFSAVMPKEADDSTVVLDVLLNNPDGIKAPIKRGDILGKAKVIYAGKELGTVDLVAASDINRSLLMVILNFFKDVFALASIKIIFGILIAGVVVFLATCVILNRNKKKVRKKNIHRGFYK